MMRWGKSAFLVDAYEWFYWHTPSYRRRAYNLMAEDKKTDYPLGIAARDYCTMWAGTAAWEFQQYWRAWREVVRFSRDDLKCGCEGLKYRLGALIALAFGRSFSGKDKSYDYCEVCCWDYHNDGYNWSAVQLDFNMKSFRFDIHTDGDCLW